MSKEIEKEVRYQINEDTINKIIKSCQLVKEEYHTVDIVLGYAGFDSLDKWPNDKKILLLKLFDLHDLDDDTLENLEITNDYLNEVEVRLQEGVKESQENDYLDLKGLKKEEHALLSDITYLIKEMLTDSPNHEENFYTLQYVHHMLLSIDNVPEIKYLLAYLSKTCGFVKPDVFKFNEDKQKIFEGIIHSAFTLYNSGDSALKTFVSSPMTLRTTSSSPSKIIETSFTSKIFTLFTFFSTSKSLQSWVLKNTDSPAF